jgi:sarcosine oxidase
VRVGVVGAGVTGLAVTDELLRLGHDVRCFEAATPMAARSTGGTRIFRLAHWRPELVDWAMQARDLWDVWSEAAGERLVGSEGVVLSGRADGDIAEVAAAMGAAGAPFEESADAPGLPAERPDGPFLVDPAGGALQAAATGRFLLSRAGRAIVRERVTAVGVEGDRALVTTATGTVELDSLVVTAGAGTAPLAAGVGVDVPRRLVHHARFTYPLRDPAATPPCWLDRSESWRTGFTTYQHVAAPGQWAVGGHVDDEQVRADRGLDEVVTLSRDLVTRYVAEYVTGAEPTAVDVVTCDFEEGLGDGLSSERAGPVLVLWGDNLFKLAPVIGRVVARAAAELSRPAELAAVAHVE